MTVPRIYVHRGVAGSARPGDTAALDPVAAHHVARVLRLRRGNPVVLFDGSGGEFDATVQTVAREQVRVVVERHRPVSRESDLHVCLVLGVSRGERMDWALQKTVELGVSEIAPVLSERSVVKLEPERGERRMAHWARVVRSACEQSGRTRLPCLHPPRPLSEWLAAGGPPGTRIALDPIAPPLSEQVAPAAAVVLAVGPEGGFSEAELERLDAHGFRRVSLGPRTLRTETAAAAAVLLAQLRWGDMG